MVKNVTKIRIGLIGCGNVGSGVVKFLQKGRSYIRRKFRTEFILKGICDQRIKERFSSREERRKLGKTLLTTKWEQIVHDPEIDVVIELIGGLHPAQEIVLTALQNGKHVVTANKALLAHCGKALFQEAHRQDCNIYFESAVMAGVPVIKLICEGLAGNQFRGLYGIINGTCNYILTEMTNKNYTFSQALAEAKKRGFAERNPTLDINGMDSTNKLAILISLTLGRFIAPEDIHTEGITHISHDDVEYAESLNLCIKLMAIAKRVNNEIEARVHPTLIAKDHPLASIHGIFNAVFLDARPQGDILISGEGAGQMTAASGVISDLIHLASRQGAAASAMLGNIYQEEASIKIRKIDQVYTKFYLRFMATDKPGVLAKITGILGRHGISINSVTQKAHSHAATVPVIMLTEYALEKKVRLALEEIERLFIVKSKPVAIRMENLPLTIIG